jgi:PAS domain S-box-containing protein
MTLLDGMEIHDTLTALVQARHAVLERATALMQPRTEIPFVEQFDALPSISALLMTSLEELKVAEEELRRQNELLAAQRSAIDEVARHYRQLFLHAPLPTFVTDSYATIQEANLAAARLFRREATHLERKPVSAMLAPEQRESFRRQLSLMPPDGVRDWRLLLHRVGDLPVTVSAAVQPVPSSGPGKPGLLYWMLKVSD